MMNDFDNENLIKILIVVFIIYAFIASVFDNSVVKAAEVSSDYTTEVFTSEEQESIEKANHLTDKDHDNILNASQKLLDSFGDIPQVSTSTDADFDIHAYLTYGLDQELFDSSTPQYKMLDDIYRMILSIRNCIVVLLIGLICVWVHKIVKSVILSFSKGGRNT